MGMSLVRFLAETSSVELSQRLALDVIRKKEHDRTVRMAKAKHGR